MKKSLIFILSFSLLLNACKAQTDDLSFQNKFEKLTDDNFFKTPGYHNWCPSIIKGEDGKYHMFYSRWKDDFSAWLLFSEVAHATSDTPNGPWTYKETVLQGRGKGYWDAITAHNPKIKYFEGKYYLYYCSTNANDTTYTHEDLVNTFGKSLKESPLRKKLRENQRTGVAFSNSLDGPWERMDHTLIEPSGPITTLTVNPAITQGKDGKYYLIVKGDKPNEKRFVRNQAMAISDSPIGPFVMQPKAVIDDLDTEDMSIWYDKKRDRFYAVFHASDFIGMVTSKDGLNWEKAKNYVVRKKIVPTPDGNEFVPARFERPFVYIENDEPINLSVAVLDKYGDFSYNLVFPLKKE